MKKRTLFIVLLMMLAIPTVLAKPPIYQKARSAYNNFPKNLYLFEKDPSDWSVVDGGAWGKLNDYGRVFNAFHLEPGTSYTLLYDAEWGGTNYIAGQVVTDSQGTIHMKPTGTPTGKVWLVLSSDLSGNTFIAWNPTEYLFEYNVLP